MFKLFYVATYNPKNDPVKRINSDAEERTKRYFALPLHANKY